MISVENLSWGQSYVSSIGYMCFVCRDSFGLCDHTKNCAYLRKELSTVEIRQYFNRVESPTAAEVKVTETGLMDDSVKSIRTVYRFKNVEGDWERTSTQKEFQCARGKNTKTFQTANCP